MRATFPIGIAAILCLTACLDRGAYPSLKPRPFERTARNPEMPVPPPPAVPARPEIVAKAAELLTRGEAGQRAFAAELDQARAVVARAGAPDSESWITAQEQLSGLEASRSDTVLAMAEIDALNLSGVDAAGLKFGEADFAVLRSAGEKVGEILEAQERVLADLASAISLP